jgi:hypothetical protein
MFTVGVTGTNGKTSTTHMLAAAFAAAGHSTLRIGTVGVDLDGQALPRGKRFSDFLATMQLAADRGCRHAVLEATSRALAQGYARAWRFDLGVFTNLSPDHFTTHDGDGDGDGDPGDGDGDNESFTCTDGSTIPIDFVCDEGADCPDGSDEVTGCGIPAAACADGMEIPADFLCDEFGDCNDNSDEITGCGLDAFVCDDGYHIDASWECDTTPDCPDSSDEANC